MSAGIDYGLGQSNIDHVTGIRYGVISQHDVCQAWSDSVEPDYGEASCPKCGNAAQAHNTFEYAGKDLECEVGHGCNAGASWRHCARPTVPFVLITMVYRTQFQTLDSHTESVAHYICKL